MKDVKVVFCGVPRSGSTLMWQVFTHILPELAHHNPIPGARLRVPGTRTTPKDWKPDGESWALVTIRHPYDISGSKYTIKAKLAKPLVLRNVLEDERMAYFLLKDNPAVMKEAIEKLAEHREAITGEKAVKAVARYTRRQFECLKHLKETYKKLIIFRYEEFFENFEPFYLAIEKLFGIKISKDTRKEVSALCNVEANYKRSRAPEDEINGYFEKFWLSRKHIQAPELNSWKRIIPEEYRPALFDMLGQTCEEWGYANSE